MSSTNSYQKGAIAQCADSQSPNVRSTQWACVTKIRNNNTVEELYIFDDEQGAKDCTPRATLPRRIRPIAAVTLVTNNLCTDTSLVRMLIK